MIELGNKVETYEVSVAVMVPVKRLVRIEASSDSHARYLAVEKVNADNEAGIDHEWSIPQVSRSSVDSDQVMLGPMVLIHHSAISTPMMSGMCPTKVES